MPERAGRFRLWKYYLDCVGDDGAVRIGYVGGLRWGPLSVHYAALLECDARGARERRTYQRVPEPTADGGGISWECQPLGVSGTWREGTPAHEARLLDGPAGSIDWRVLAPRARGRIEAGPGAPVAGWGYVERLELDIEPWRLPLDTLYWGRFHSPTDVLVWIGWEGEVRLRHILHNGALLAGGSFGGPLLQFQPDIELSLTETRTIRDAPVIAALDRLPRVLRRVPPAFLAAREVKWLSRARLSSPHRAPASGWALHERVQFR